MLRMIPAAGQERRAATVRRRHRLPRVGYVLTVYPRLSETFVVNEIAALEHLGLEIVAFSQKRPLEPPALAAARARAPVVYLDLRPRAWLGLLRDHLDWLIWDPRRYWRQLCWVVARRNRPTLKRWLRAGRLAAECRRRGITHLHAHFLSGNTRLARLAAELAGITYSLTAHAKDIYAVGLSRTKIRRRIRGASFAVTVSEFNRRHLEEIAGADQVRVIRNGVDLRRLVYRPPAAPRPLVLAVGRLVPKKGFDVLVEALARLGRGEPQEGGGAGGTAAAGAASGWQAWIIGDGPERQALAERIARHGVGERVRLLGARPHASVINELIPQAAVVAVPSVVAADGDRDGLPTVIPEAMAIGVPVVATGVTGIPEIVRDGETGRLVPAGDPAALAAVLRELLADPQQGRELARRARRLIEEEYDLRRSAWRLLACLAGTSQESHGAFPGVPLDDLAVPGARQRGEAAGWRPAPEAS